MQSAQAAVAWVIGVAWDTHPPVPFTIAISAVGPASPTGNAQDAA